MVLVTKEYRWPLCGAIFFHIILLLLLIMNFSWSTKVATENNNTIQASLISSQQLQSLVKEVKPLSTPPAQPTVEQQKIKQEKVAQAQQAAVQKQQADQKAVELAKQQALKQQQAVKLAAQKVQQQKQQKLKQKSLEQSLLQEELQNTPTPSPQKNTKQLEKMLQNQMAMEMKSEQTDKPSLTAAQQGEVDKYKAMILQQIQQNWIVPGKVDALSCVLSISVAPGGMVTQVKLVKSSGNDALDRSAIAAVNKASPLPVPSNSLEFAAFRTFTLTVMPNGD